MRKFAVLSCLLLLGACSTFNPTQIANTPVPTVKAQQTVDLLQATHKATLRAELIYIMQPACGLPASSLPPLCASYAVGKEMKRLDDIATREIARAQTAIDTLGSNPAAIDAAVAAAQLAVSTLQTYTAKYEVKK